MCEGCYWSKKMNILRNWCCCNGTSENEACEKLLGVSREWKKLRKIECEVNWMCLVEETNIKQLITICGFCGVAGGWKFSITSANECK